LFVGRPNVNVAMMSAVVAGGLDRILVSGGGVAGIESLLALKHAIGLPYTTSERHLRNFDAMCAQDFPGQTTLSREMAIRWAAGRLDG
jgi:hypothetical protein